LLRICCQALHCALATPEPSLRRQSALNKRAKQNSKPKYPAFICHYGVPIWILFTNYVTDSLTWEGRSGNKAVDVAAGRFSAQSDQSGALVFLSKINAKPTKQIKCEGKTGLMK